jgi:hypothetical protein
VYNVGDNVWVEDDDECEPDEVNLTQLRIIDINESVVRNSVIRYYRLESNQWHLEEELYLNKKDLIESLIKQNTENQEELILDIQAIIHDLEDLKDKAGDLGARQGVLEKLRETT